MAINETIVTGRKYRRCVDAATKAWQRISFWTKSTDVEFEDGKNAEEKIGAIDATVNQLNNSLGGNVLTYNESEDAFYIQNVGADSVPKKLGESQIEVMTARIGTCRYVGDIPKYDGWTFVGAYGSGVQVTNPTSQMTMCKYTISWNDTTITSHVNSSAKQGPNNFASEGTVYGIYVRILN